MFWPWTYFGTEIIVWGIITENHNWRRLCNYSLKTRLVVSSVAKLMQLCPRKIDRWYVQATEPLKQRIELGEKR